MNIAYNGDFLNFQRCLSASGALNISGSQYVHDRWWLSSATAGQVASAAGYYGSQGSIQFTGLDSFALWQALPSRESLALVGSSTLVLSFNVGGSGSVAPVVVTGTGTDQPPSLIGSWSGQVSTSGSAIVVSGPKRQAMAFSVPSTATQFAFGFECQGDVQIGGVRIDGGESVAWPTALDAAADFAGCASFYEELGNAAGGLPVTVADAIGWANDGTTISVECLMRFSPKRDLGYALAFSGGNGAYLADPVSAQQIGQTGPGLTLADGGGHGRGSMLITAQYPLASYPAIAKGQALWLDVNSAAGSSLAVDAELH